MMPFMALAAVMVLAALAIVIIPLVRRTRRTTSQGEDLTVLADGMRELDAELAAGDVSQAEYDRARTELERQALRSEQAAQAQAQSSQRANWAVALATAIALPLLAATLYLTVGQPAVLGSGSLLARADGGAPQAPDEATIAMLKARVAKDAKDAEGWVLLARANFQLGHMDEAAAAYAKATGLVADNANLWVEYANTVAIAHNRDLSGEPTAMVERALKLDPDNFNALAFAGLAAFQRGDHAAALEHWRHLKALLPEGGEDAKAIDDLIARAGGGEAQRPSETAQTPAPQAQAAIGGTVTLASALTDKVAATDTLFVFARAPGGPPMPLAAIRASTSAWPVSFMLDDSSSMAPGMRLSKFSKVNLVARVSRSGSATPQPGDIEGHVDGVATGSSGVHIVLDRILEH